MRRMLPNYVAQMGGPPVRVLFVAPYTPSRIRIRLYGFIRHLARHHEVKVIALDGGKHARTDADDLEELRRMGVDVSVVHEPRLAPYLRTAHSRFTPAGHRLPLQVAFAASPRAQSAIADELRARPYDVLHVEHVRGLGALPADLATPIVWDAVDCVSLLFAEAARVAATPMTRLVGGLEAQLLRDFERQQLTRFRQILVTSERDRQALLDLARRPGSTGDGEEAQIANITVLCHGIEQPRAPVDDSARQADTLIFSGKMDYHANVAAAVTLVERILPIIWQVNPRVRLIIAGNNPPSTVQRLAHDARVTVTGYVPNLRAVISTAQIAVCPLPYAVGIQNKALEAMVVGTPVIVSSSAASGLQTVAGRDLIVADTPEAFAAETLRLLADPVARHRLAEAGARYVATCHDWDAVIAQLTAVYAHARCATVTQAETVT